MRAKKSLSDRDTHSVLRHLDAAHELYPSDIEATLLKVQGSAVVGLGGSRGAPPPQSPLTVVLYHGCACFYMARLIDR